MTMMIIIAIVIVVVMQARNLSSAMSAASSACDHIYNWLNGTPKDTWVSMGVYSDGSYDAPKASHATLPSFGCQQTSLVALDSMLCKSYASNSSRCQAIETTVHLDTWASMPLDS